MSVKQLSNFSINKYIVPKKKSECKPIPNQIKKVQIAIENNQSIGMFMIDKDGSRWGIMPENPIYDPETGEIINLKPIPVDIKQQQVDK